MKKLLLLAVSVALFAACSDKVQINESPEIPIDFTKVYVEKGTKVAPGLYTTENFATAGNTMGVYGWKEVTKNSTTTDTPIFTNQEVDYSVTTSGKWGYSPKKYWDSNADKYIFYAYAPHSSDFPNGGTITAPTATNEKAFAITGFSQSTTVANQIDLLVDLTSQKNNTYNKNITKDLVSFAFKHILTQVNFKMGVSADLKADKTNNPVTIQSVKLNNVVVNGTYSYNTTSTAWEWARLTTTNTFEATPSSNAFFTSDHLTATAELVPGLNKMLLIPGSVSSYTITVNYTIGTEPYEKTINLTDFKDGNNSLTTWAIGYNYTYVLTIGPDPIEFGSPEIDEWTTGGTYSYTIE